MTLARPAVLTAFMTLFLGGAAAGPPLRAQALVTASKAGDIAVFGGYTRSSPDFGAAIAHGFTFGADFTFAHRWHIDPGIEARFDHTSTGILTEHAFLFGPRANLDYGRFHPYADVMFGAGGVGYNPPPVFSPKDHADGGIDLAFGGGVDVDLVHHFALKVDYQAQRLNLGVNQAFKPDGSNYTLTPQNVTIGVVYHIGISGLSGLRKQRELH